MRSQRIKRNLIRCSSNKKKSDTDVLGYLEIMTMVFYTRRCVDGGPSPLLYVIVLLCDGFCQIVCDTDNGHDFETGTEQQQTRCSCGFYDRFLSLAE